MLRACGGRVLTTTIGGSSDNEDTADEEDDEDDDDVDGDLARPLDVFEVLLLVLLLLVCAMLALNTADAEAAEVRLAVVDFSTIDSLICFIFDDMLVLFEIFITCCCCCF